ncbi:MAG: DUF805 domain-containing protein [Pseudomonadota bacterium]
MADVFISYAREDKPSADRIANALKGAGYDVFWDSEIPPGQTWADYIEGKLASAKIAVVLWSATSTKSQWVREEARMGRDRGKLIPVMIDATPAPFGFGEVQAADLSGWTGDVNDPRWQRFRGAVDMSVQRAASAAPSAPSPPAPPQPPPHQQQYYAPPPAAPPRMNIPLLNAKTTPGSPFFYVQKCLKLYVNANGRARRSEYWWFVLFNFVVSFVAGFLDISLSGVNTMTGQANAPIFSSIVFLGLLCPSICVAIRRFHDRSMSGWVYAGALVAIFVGVMFAALVPALGLLVVLGVVVTLIVVLALPGTAGTNAYGPDPKQGPADVF